MSFFSYDQDTIKNSLLDKVQANLKTNKITDYNISGIFRAFIEIVAYFIYLFYELLEKIFLNVFAATATGSWLDSKCKDVGISRTSATKATGYFTFARETAENTNIKIAAGKIIKTATTSSGKQYSFVVAEDTILPANSTSVKVLVNSNGTGTAYNIASGTSLSLATPIDGIDSVTVEDGWLTTYAEDEESDDDLRDRYTLKWTASNSGNKAYYKELALEVEGVKDVNVITVSAGAINVVITSTAGGTASSDLITSVQTVLNNNLLFDGVTVTAVAAAVVSHALNITLSCYSLTDTEANFISEIRNAISTYISANITIGKDFVPGKLAAYLYNNYSEIKNIVFSDETVTSIGNNQILGLSVGTITVNTGAEE
jgi:uncharacterized phage protein gp47/JayE